MAEIPVAAERREDRGSRESRRLRRAGKIPGVVYGHGTEALPVAVEVRALRSALTTEAGSNALIDLSVGSQRHLVVARELQRHPVRGTVDHVDFQVVRRDEVISAEVPVSLVGEATEVAHGDGRVEQLVFSLAVKALPGNIPTGIEVDVSGLQIGATIKVSEIALPDKVTTDVDPETAIVVGQAPRKAAGVEGAEGAEAAAAAAAPAGETEPATAGEA